MYRTPIFFAFVFVLISHSCWACCMVPADFIGSISQNAQKAILWHHDSRQEMVLGIDYQISGETMPKHFAWVVTVPHEPDEYQVVPSQIFTEIGKWAMDRVVPKPQPQGGGCSIGCSALPQAATDSKKVDDVILGKFAQVGPYAIQPVRAKGIDALEGLNRWLTENGFPSEEPDHMKYFVENGFTFLCIKISPTEGEGQVASHGQLPALHMSFETDELYYPLRFSSRQGVFDLQLTVLTSVPVDFNASADTLHEMNWSARRWHKNVTTHWNQIPGSLKDTLANQNRLIEPPDAWYLNLLLCEDVNSGDSIATWTEDVFLSTNADAQVHHAAILDAHAVLTLILLSLLWSLGRRYG